MLYREIIAVFSQIHTKHTNTLCGQNVELLNVKLAVYTYNSDCWVLGELCRRVILLDPEDKSPTIRRNVGNCSPRNAAALSRRLEASISAFRFPKRFFPYNSSCLHHLPCMQSFRVFAHARLQSQQLSLNFDTALLQVNF